MSATWTLATNYWFVRRRGLALAINLSGSGLASTFAPLYVTRLVQAYGWRVAFIGLGLPSLLIALPAVLLLFPRDVRAAAANRAKRPGMARPGTVTDAAAPLEGLPLGRALVSWRLWVLSIALALVVIGIFGLVPNMMPIMMDTGLSAGQAASIVGLIGISLTISRLGSGYLIDRLWAPGIAAVLLSTPALACLLLLSGVHHPMALVLVVVLTGVGTGAENDIAAYLTARYFGLREYGSLFATVNMVITAGNLVGPLMFGYLYNSTGSYNSMLAVCAVLFVTGASMVLTLGEYPRFESAPRTL
jgi:MFS family permease